MSLLFPDEGSPGREGDKPLTEQRCLECGEPAEYIVGRSPLCRRHLNSSLARASLGHPPREGVERIAPRESYISSIEWGLVFGGVKTRCDVDGVESQREADLLVEDLAWGLGWRRKRWWQFWKWERRIRTGDRL